MHRNVSRLIFPFLLMLLLFPAARILAYVIPTVTYTDEQGLPSSVILSILQDRDGFLWLGNYTGVCRYDGNEFINATRDIEDECIGVFSSCQDTGGALWFGSYKGLFRYDGRTWRKFDKKDGLDDSIIACILQDRKNRMWVLSWKNLYLLEDSVLSKVELPGVNENESFFCAVQDSSGNLWITSSRSVFRYDGKGFVRFAQPVQMVTAYVDSKGILWVGTENGARRFEGLEFVDVDLGCESKPNRVFTIGEDGDNSIWFGTDRGIYILGNGVKRHIGVEEGLPDALVWKIFKDRSNIMWVATEAGLTKIIPSPFVSFSNSDGLPSDQYMPCLEDREGNLWAGSAKNGPFRFDGHSWKRFGDDRLKNLGIMNILQDSRSRLWFGTRNNEGVFCAESGRLWQYKSPVSPSANSVKCLFEDSSGRIWVGTLDGILRYSGNRWERIGEEDGLPGKEVYSIVEDRLGRIWIGTFGSGASYYENGKWVSVDTTDGLRGSFILQIYRDSKDQLWFSTAGAGISVFDGEKFISYNVKNGLASNTCYSILEDGGKMYFGTNQGLSVFDGEKFRNYTTADGLTSNLFHRTCFRDSNGFIWFGTTKGLTRFEPNKEEVTKAPLNVKIMEAISLKNTAPVATNDSLQYWENDIQIKYTACEFKEAKKLKFRYVLEGYGELLSVTDSREIRFTNLPPGAYRFKIWAVNRLGQSSPEPATMTFIIEPPFWMTAWFKTLWWSCLAAMAMSILILWRKKHNAKLLMRSNLDLSRKVESLGQEIENRKVDEKKRVELSRIDTLQRLAGCVAKDFQQIMADLIGDILVMKLSLSYDPERAGESLAEVEKNLLRAQSITRQLQALALSGDRVRQPLSVEKVLIDATGYTVRESKNIQVKYCIEGDLWQTSLEAVLLNQIFQNIVLNAVQAMPNGGLLEVSAENTVHPNTEENPQEERKHLRITFKDNGVGIAPAHLNRIFEPFFTTKDSSCGLGLTTAADILKGENGRISVTSELGKGTTVTILLPAAESTGQTEGATGTPRLLVVGEECGDSKILVLMLDLLGFEVTRARDGREAVELCNKYIKDDIRIKALIVDSAGRWGVSWGELLDRLSGMDPQISILAVSDEQHDSAEYKDKPDVKFKAVITRPFTMRKIKAALKAAEI